MSATLPSEDAARSTYAAALASARYVALLVAVLSGFATVLSGVVAGTPAPALVWRAAAVFFGVRVVAGWVGALLAASLRRSPAVFLPTPKKEDA
jgi:hypothetical protein